MPPTEVYTISLRLIIPNIVALFDHDESCDRVPEYSSLIAFTNAFLLNYSD